MPSPIAAGKGVAFGVAGRRVAPCWRRVRAFVFKPYRRIKSVSRDHSRTPRLRQRSNSTNSDADVDNLDQPPPPLFPPCDAYSSARALVLSLLICSFGAGGGVGTLADLLSSVLPLADARAAAAFAVEAAQLAAVSLVVSSSVKNPEREEKPLLTFDPSSGNDVVLGIAGGAVAVLAVAAADSLLPSSSSLSPTATDVATSTMAAASFPLGRLALLAAGCALAPATEELVFRGVLLRSLLGRREASPPSSSVPALLSPLSPEVAASAAAFAASHLPVLLSDGSASVAARESILLALLGSVLGATAVAANGSRDDGSFDLAAPIVAHALYNATVYAFG